LAQVLRRLPPIVDPNVLVGTETRDDAAVYRLDAKRSLVVTTDFFSPVVDDAWSFGQVAAANALSDVYAMGGRPLLALNLVAFPSKQLPMSILGRILEGGADKVTEAGASLVGGHSVEDTEP
jgi:selenide,water dikinase